MGLPLRTIGERIRDMRRACHMSRGSVAKALEVSNTSVRNWENGVCAPRAPIINLLSDLFHCDACNLTGVHSPPSFPLDIHLPSTKSLQDYTDADLLEELARRLVRR